jgi:hypothetical protein
MITPAGFPTYLKAAMHADQRKQPTRKSAPKLPVHVCIDLLGIALYLIFSFSLPTTRRITIFGFQFTTLSAPKSTKPLASNHCL